MKRTRIPQRPWCCPEPRCQPVHQLAAVAYQDLSDPDPGESFSCFGRAPRVEFSYDGSAHANDTRSCHYTPLKGLIAYQENADDWVLLADAYRTASQKLAASPPSQDNAPETEAA